MIKRLAIPLTILLTIVLLFIGGTLWWTRASRPVSQNESSERFVIPRGYSASQIGAKLEDEEIIRSSFAFKFYSQLTGKSKNIQSGEYVLSPNLSLEEVVGQLILGPRELWVTVPEGLRREQIVDRFINTLQKSGEEAVIFRGDFLGETSGLEGYLFPDTYLFPREASASAVVSKMNNTFDLRIDDLEEGIENSELTLNEIITLASIIERESRNDEERPVVAGILLNRLDIGMALQADATVQYAVGTTRCEAGEDCNWWPILTREDLAIDSPFNSYLYQGLPPHPIANPGISSIRAAVFPEETDYFYYIHDKDGNIHYARTLEEHNANVSRYLRN